MLAIMDTAAENPKKVKDLELKSYTISVQVIDY